MQYLLRGFADWYAKRHQRTGHLFQGRFKAEQGFSEFPNRMTSNRFTEEKVNERRASYAGTKLLLEAYETGLFYSSFDEITTELEIRNRHFLDTELIVVSAVEDTSN